MEGKIEKKKLNKYEVWQPFLLSIMMVIGILIGYKMNDKSEHLITSLPSDQKIEIGRVEEILRLIETRYVDHVDRNKLIENAIEGLLVDLDPHSIYLKKEYVSDVNDNMDGNFKGIGIESHMYLDTAIIIKVVENSPAYNAGLRQFDKIIKVNNKNVAGVKISLDSLKNLMRVNSEVVNIEIFQFASKKALIKNIKTEEITIHSADISYLLNDSTGYIQIKQFSSNTYNEFMNAFEELVDKKKAKHLVIDLRGNPGGYLPQATKIVNQLIREKKQLIVSTKDKSGNTEEYLTTGHSFFNVGKIAILVDENSASGSEVIAGAVQDHDRGMIIGHNTYGKGLVQEQFNLSNGAAIRLTTAKYYTPSGRSIQKDYDRSNQKSEQKIYKTLHLKRDVVSNNGIVPDYVITIDSAAPIQFNYYLLRNQIIDFLLNKYLNSGFPKFNNLDFTALSKDFVKQNTHKELQNISEATIVGLMKSEVQYLSTNGDDKSISINQSKDDAYIIAALQYIKDEIKLK